MSGRRHIQVIQSSEAIEVLNGMFSARAAFEPEISTIDSDNLIFDPFRAAAAFSAQAIVEYNRRGVEDFSLLERQYAKAQQSARKIIEMGGAIVLEAIDSEKKVA